MTFRPITIRTTDARRRQSPAKRAVRVIQGLQQKLSPLRRKIRDDVEVTAPMRPAPRGPALGPELPTGEGTVPETGTGHSSELLDAVQTASTEEMVAERQLTANLDTDVYVSSAN